MRSKPVLVTEKNINRVCGRIKKVFKEKEGYIAVTAHSFEGWRGKPYNNYSNIHNTPKVSISDKGSIDVKYSHIWGMSIPIGSRVLFKGDTIIVQREFMSPPYTIIYQTCSYRSEESLDSNKKYSDCRN